MKASNLNFLSCLFKKATPNSIVREGDWVVKSRRETLTNVDITRLQMQMIGVGKYHWKIPLGEIHIELGEIHTLFREKSSDAPNEALISHVCKCRLLGLTNAKQPNQQIQISAVRKSRCVILTNARGPDVIFET